MIKNQSSKALLVAGGTGGHINAALALGEKLMQKNFEVHYMSGERTLDYKLFKNENVTHLKASPLRFKNPIKLMTGLFKNIKTFFSVWSFLRNYKPNFVVGAGGYVCGPSLLAAKILGIKVYIIEQNSVMGLTNKILGFIANKIFVHFSKTLGLSASLKKKVIVSGNPIRNKIGNQVFKKKKPENNLNVLVFGGSLGAKEVNELVAAMLNVEFAVHLDIHHQTGLDNEEIKPAKNESVTYKSFKYIENMSEEYSWADIIISRAGASTVSEVRVVGKPVIFIPYPLATDNHQKFNAEFFKNEVSFPVFINTGKELSRDGAKLLKQHIIEIKTWLERNYQVESGLQDHSADKVIEEILSDSKIK